MRAINKITSRYKISVQRIQPVVVVWRLSSGIVAIFIGVTRKEYLCRTKLECRKAECTLRLMHFGVTSVQEVSSLNGPAASNDRTSRPIETSNSILSTCTSEGSCPRIIVHVQIASTGETRHQHSEKKRI